MENIHPIIAALLKESERDTRTRDVQRNGQMLDPVTGETRPEMNVLDDIIMMRNMSPPPVQQAQQAVPGQRNSTEPANGPAMGAEFLSDEEYQMLVNAYATNDDALKQRLEALAQSRYMSSITSGNQPGP